MFIATSVGSVSGVDSNYAKVDNLHIYYSGNRITGVLEDADPVTTNGSMDYAGTTGKEM